MLLPKALLLYLQMNSKPHTNNKMNALDEGNKASIVTQGSTTAVMTQYATDAYFAMLPFFMVLIPLVIIGVRLERKKALMQGKNLTILQTAWAAVDKMFSYICWIMLSVTLSIAFGCEAIRYVIMVIIFGLEVLVIISAWFKSKGIDVSEVEMVKILFKALWARVTGSSEDFKNVFRQYKEATVRKEEQDGEF